MSVKMSGLQTEAQLQAAVIELAQLLGWKVAHFRPARTKDSWRTPVAADGKGFPDLVLVKGERLLVVELKSESGRLTDEQRDWLADLRGAGVDVRVWRPSNWDVAVETLRGDA